MDEDNQHIDHYVKRNLDPKLELAINTIKVFNLNEPSLKNRRKDSMQMVRTMLQGGMQKEDILNTLSSDGFVSAIEYELSFA